MSRLPSSQLAQYLVECGREDPSLLQSSGRPPAPSSGESTVLRRTPGRSVSGVSTELWHYIEDLVSMTAGTAEDAVGASRQARDAARTARRGMIAFAGLGAAGAMAGIAGLAGLHVYHTTMQRRLTELTAEVSALHSVQQQTNIQLAQLRQEYAIALRQQPELAPAVIASAAPDPMVTPAPRLPVSPAPRYAYYPPLGGYSYYPPPSPDPKPRRAYRAPARRAVVPPPRPEPPRIISLFLRDIRGLFH